MFLHLLNSYVIVSKWRSEKKKEAHARSPDRSSLMGGLHELQRDGGNHKFSLSRSLDLTKLNPNCQMNYSNLFVTEY